MFILYADKNKLTLWKREMMTSGSVNVYQVRFEFSSDWNGLTRTAIFRAGTESRAVLLDESGEATVPWEVLKKPSMILTAGVYGTQGGHTVLPTIWTSLGQVFAGAHPDEKPWPPTPELWEQALDQKGDRLDYTEAGELGLYSGEKLLSSVPIESSGGEGGTTDHRRLSHRDAEEQHPIESITGLAEELERIPEPVEALSNSELEEILK